jgi:hypothetical protein
MPSTESINPRRARGQQQDRFWSGRRDLNPRLRPWQGRTLPLSYSRFKGQNTLYRDEKSGSMKPLWRAGGRLRRNTNNAAWLCDLSGWTSALICVISGKWLLFPASPQKCFCFSWGVMRCCSPKRVPPFAQRTRKGNGSFDSSSASLGVAQDFAWRLKMGHHGAPSEALALILAAYFGSFSFSLDLFSSRKPRSWSAWSSRRVHCS